jgi:multiple antibiotic resistance protein
LHLARTPKPTDATDATDATDECTQEAAVSGATPLGIPLVMGPASITTIILAVKSCGYFATFLAIGLNLFIVWVAFRNSQHLIKLIGPKNMNVLAKLASLVLVSIAVMMIRVGIKSFFN